MSLPRDEKAVTHKTPVKDALGQLGGLAGAGVAAACCLGIPVILSAVGAVGLGFVVQDAYLMPLFVVFVGFSLFMLYRSARKHDKLAPFWLGVAAATVSTTALWLLVTGLWPQPMLLYAGLTLLIAASLWDVLAWHNKAAACEPTPAPPSPTDKPPAQRIATGTLVAAAASGLLYGLYESVHAFAPTAAPGEIACWGINACRAKTACTTAFNACTAQNDCRGRGYIYVSAATCETQGGVPLLGSEGDPSRGQ